MDDETKGPIEDAMKPMGCTWYRDGNRVYFAAKTAGGVIREVTREEFCDMRGKLTELGHESVCLSPIQSFTYRCE